MGTQKRNPERGKWAAAVAGLLSEPTITAAAARSGVPVSTLRKWLNKPPFQRYYRDARLAVVEAAIGQIQAGTAAAVATLRANLNAPDPADQIRAARTFLEFSLRGVELCGLLEKVAELESLVNEMKASNEPPKPNRQAP
jgi:hypothetical protein